MTVEHPVRRRPASARSLGRTTRGALSVALLAALVVACGGSGDTTATPTVPTSEPTTTTSTSTTAPAPARLPLVIAHRGASAYAPEHTFASYDLALAQGADHIEQDLQLTADGELVVLHDPVLDRTARGPASSCSGLVSEKTLAQLQECEVGSWFNDAYPERADPSYVGLRIPTMAQVLDRYGSDTRYYIELKATDAGSGMEAPLIALLADAGMLGMADEQRPVIVQSFGPEVLETVHGLEPDLPLVLLLRATGVPVDGSTLDAAREYAVGIGPPAAIVDRALVDAAHERCLEVHPYTVDDPAEMARLIDAGVDGIFTNAPDILRTALAGARPLPTCATDRTDDGA